MKYDQTRIVKIPRWDVERMNTIIRNQEEMGFALTDCSDQAVAGRTLRFDRRR